MSKAEILAELPRLNASELAEVQAKLDELAGESWHPHSDLSDADKAALGGAIASHQDDPNSGSPWDAVKERIRSKLQP